MLFCSRCGTPNEEGAAYCGKCGHALNPNATPPTGEPTSASAAAGGAAASAGAAPPGFQTPADTPPPVHGEPAAPAGPNDGQGKNPTLAVVLSIFIIGLGQFYNGDVKKGLVMLLGAVGFGILTGGIAWLPLVLWSGLDAYQVATGKWQRW